MMRFIAICVNTLIFNFFKMWITHPSIIKLVSFYYYDNETYLNQNYFDKL